MMRAVLFLLSFFVLSLFATEVAPPLELDLTNLYESQKKADEGYLIAGEDRYESRFLKLKKRSGILSNKDKEKIGHLV